MHKKYNRRHPFYFDLFTNSFFSDDILDDFGFKTSIVERQNVLDDNINQDNGDYQKFSVKDGTYYLINVPGFNKTNLEITGENGKINISGEREVKLGSESKTENVNYTMSAPDVDFSTVEATIADGILTLFIPGVEKKKKKKSTSIKIS